MTKTEPFHASDEENKPFMIRIYHDNELCPRGRDIPLKARQAGTAHYRLCEQCNRMNLEGK